ncbi:head-tail connector protein [Prevotella sp. OH937_COT-195]|uniref:head-tail connector protein n=1 Tax=Prevotella sp. OH937_COT-195 TaxID=2491051 RepID=UPI000F6535A9|nr:head-tail connector protein [Prevotella sp. OH937_COT-195]RRC99054.1 phage gp6-like head-tail connector protein [Prevotella sp. OH937_COT-195]
MANVVSLELFKQHVRADDFADDDVYLQHLLDTAEKHVIRVTNRDKDELVEMGGGEFPAELKHAILLIGAHWYNQRESDSTTQMHSVPDSLQALIKPFRKLVE